MQESAQWYESQKEGLGMRFIEAVEDKIITVQQNPFHYQLKHKNTRLALIKRFPYAIYFILDEKKIFVLAILSTHRNPKI